MPLRKYLLIKMEKDNMIKAMAVFRARYIFGIRCGILVDLISHSNSIGIENLMNSIHKISIENKLDLILTTVPVQSPEFRMLKEEGYFSMPPILLPQKLALIIQCHLQSYQARVSDFKKWFLTFGDYDIF
mgnify:CR=1 FL=1